MKYFDNSLLRVRQTNIIIFSFLILLCITSCTPEELLKSHEEDFIKVFLYYMMCILSPTIIHWALMLCPQENVKEIRTYDKNHNKSTSYVGTGEYFFVNQSQAVTVGNISFLLFSAWLFGLGYLMNNNVTLSEHSNLDFFLQFLIIPFIIMPLTAYLINKIFGYILTYIRYFVGVFAIGDTIYNIIIYLLN